VVGLDYANPYLSPFEEFQRFKTHPAIRAYLEGGKRLAYGARAIAAGGLQSLPELIFPGGALIGDDAGFLNAARIKGSHGAIKSGMLAADAIFDALGQDRRRDRLEAYPAAFRNSWLHAELHATRNFKPYMKRRWLGSLLFGLDQKLLRGKAPGPCTTADHDKLRPAAERARSTIPSRTACSPSTACRRSSSPTPTTRKPALPPAAEGCRRADQHQPGTLRRPETAIARPACMKS
jgi:electron-transferring-flavoprotein dehydrogenase